MTDTVTAAADLVQPAPAHAEAFTFGDPMPVLSQRELFDYLEAITANGTNRHCRSAGWLASIRPRCTTPLPSR